MVSATDLIHDPIAGRGRIVVAVAVAARNGEIVNSRRISEQVHVGCAAVDQFLVDVDALIRVRVRIATAVDELVLLDSELVPAALLRDVMI